MSRAENRGSRRESEDETTASDELDDKLRDYREASPAFALRRTKEKIMATKTTATENRTDVQRAETEEDVIRINDFFNLQQIIQELHSFTFRDNLIRAFERDDRELYYTEAGGEITAGLMVWCESRILEEDEAQIRLTATHPEHREQGLAHTLVSTAIEFARQHEKEMMKAETDANSPAVAFWEACGFKKTSFRETKNGRKMVMMVREL
ncbi:GNAT family N-acetyltransferase [Halorussus caseinilyticus]|uniref:GNAT family N-acetyltransferase n=1 Tax=Halorussus caseinilyticus TaxID=3034025 RepID=UPI0023E7DF69|nr:GNAT family N-acetyltransferase [Halorussus sp. DT72]